MKKWTVWLVMIVALVAGAAHAQDDTGIFVMQVQVDSAFVRSAPSPDAEPVASVFKGEKLEAIGRNLDGTWYEVKRPGRMYNLGWIFGKMVKGSVQAEYLPLTDFSTGIIGPNPLARPPQLAIHVVEGVAMRQNPIFSGLRIVNLPPAVTVPLLERNQDSSWLHVNYLGYDGWIIAFTTRPRPDLLNVPIAPGLPPLQTIEVEVIPPEIQLAQVERMRAFITPLYDTADYLAWLWGSVKRGERMPCEPPGVVMNTYTYSARDLQELPEIRRHAPRFESAINYLNGSIEALQGCGVKFPDMIDKAYSDAISARLIFSAILEALDNLEKNIIH